MSELSKGHNQSAAPAAGEPPQCEIDASTLGIKIFADCAEKNEMFRLYKNPLIGGFTTNPTLMKKAGIKDYRRFAQDLLRNITDLPISFEVFADEFGEMEQQANELASWGSNVYVKIPVTNTRGQFSGEVLRRITHSGIKINVTAITTPAQLQKVADCIEDRVPAIVSVFAGRIADTGRDPIPIMAEAKQMLCDRPNVELLWASTREVINIFQANSIGCDIITVTRDLLTKLEHLGRDLDQYSLETVRTFYEDAKSSGYTL